MDEPRYSVDQGKYRNAHPLRNKVGRALWHVVWLLLFRPTPRILTGWRRFLLRLFGAKIGRGSHVYASTRIWAPWNLTMGEHSALAEHVDCYCVAPVTIGSHVTVSQYTFLCTAGHDISDPHMALTSAPIRIADMAWVCADVFIGPGVSIGEGAVLAARSTVVRDVEPWAVVAGNPAKFLKKRQIRSEAEAWSPS